jgi:glycosyltransferase involved in cell wall biosynthesis
MRIALDATQGVGRGLTGVGVYSRRMLDGLAARYPEARFTHCFRTHRLWRGLRHPTARNVTRTLLLDPWWIPPCDIFHGLNQRLPNARLRKAAATFHDLFVMTGEYSSPEFRVRFEQQAREAAARADRVICVSSFTAGQVESLLGVERARLRVIPHGVDLPEELPARERDPATFLHVGTLQTRKNIVRLIRAFERLAIPGARLVLAGGWGHGAAEIEEAIRISRTAIELAGVVSDAALRAWYRRATVLAFPSLDEGFGMPVLEAMAHGLPVVTSNRSALPEAAGGAAVLVDPEDIDSIAFGMREAYENQDRLSAAGRVRVQGASWDVAVGATWKVYQELAV